MRYHYLHGTRRHARRRRMWQAGVLAALVITACASVLAVRAGDSNGAGTPRAAAKKAAQVTVLPPGLRVGDCGAGGKKHVGLEKSSAPVIKKLAEYERVCNSAVGSTSFFASLPTTAAEADTLSQQTVSTLQEFAKYNLAPVVFLEPKMLSGRLADSQAYAAGRYDTALDAYFARLKAAGITDSQMGMWVPMPEGNTPSWGNPDPVIFTQIVTRTLQLQKKYFPASRASVLLESKSYPSGAGWSGASYVSLAPYVKDIPRGLLDSLGLQGFPWGPSDTGRTAELNPAVYLRADLALEAAQAAGLQRVWFNTGTFGSFAKDAANSTPAAPVERQKMLDGVVAAAKVVQQAGLNTAIHLFAKNKSHTAEKADWSYWQAGQMADSPAAPVFKTLVRDARQAQIPIWVYDYDD